MKALITGGCGFIGSHVVRAFLADGWEVTNLDKLTYAANPANLRDVEAIAGYTFVQGDFCDADLVRRLVAGMDLVLNFAAETHVDRSLHDPAVFARTDVEGVVCLLEAIRADGHAELLHMSTDEVFGSPAAPDEADEDYAFAPSSPYSASKAAAELMIRAYRETYGVPVTVLRSCNVYGPNQHPEKFIPLFATRALSREAMPLYGDGLQEREWLYVDDLVAAVKLAAQRSSPGVLNVGSAFRIPNLEVAWSICELTESDEALIQPVFDRPGHDRRYAVNSARIRELGWAPRVSFRDGLAQTVRWYDENRPDLSAADHASWMERQYAERLSPH